MKRAFTITTVVFLILVCCCGALASEISYGEIENGRYVNDYFGMSIAVPDGWAVQSKAAQRELSGRGSDLIAGGNKNLKAALREAEKQSVHLFAFFKYEQGTPVDFNPSIASVAERVANMPGIKSGSDYLFHVKKLLQIGQIKYSFPKEMYSRTISGIQFDILPAEIDLGGRTIYQEYYAARIKDYALGFVLTHSTEPELSELEQIIGKLEITE